MRADEDLYEVLQVSPHAEPEVIEAAYRRLARKYHPDTSSGGDEAGERMRALSAAYAVLKDRARRAEYDRARGVIRQRLSASRWPVERVEPFRPRASEADFIQQPEEAAEPRGASRFDWVASPTPVGGNRSYQLRSELQWRTSLLLLLALVLGAAVWVLLASGRPLPFLGGRVILATSFDEGTERLFPVEYPAGTLRRYSGGELILSRAPGLGRNAAGLFLPPAAPGQYREVSLTVSFRSPTGAQPVRWIFGCRGQLESDWVGYQVALYPDSGSLYAGKGELWRSAALSGAVYAGSLRAASETNRIELSCSGDTLELALNGQRLVQVRDPAYADGGLLILATTDDRSAPLEARLDDLVIAAR